MKVIVVQSALAEIIVNINILFRPNWSHYFVELNTYILTGKKIRSKYGKLLMCSVL